MADGADSGGSPDPEPSTVAHQRPNWSNSTTTARAASRTAIRVPPDATAIGDHGARSPTGQCGSGNTPPSGIAHSGQLITGGTPGRALNGPRIARAPRPSPLTRSTRRLTGSASTMSPGPVTAIPVAPPSNDGSEVRQPSGANERLPGSYRSTRCPA